MHEFLRVAIILLNISDDDKFLDYSMPRFKRVCKFYLLSTVFGVSSCDFLKSIYNAKHSQW